MRRGWIWTGSIVGALVALAIVATFFIDEPLRRRVEYEMNQRLRGYSVRIGALNFHPLGFSIDFKNIVVTQDAYPDPPVARVPLLHASVQWREFVRAKLVADFLLDRPIVYFDRRHAIAEVREGIPPDKRGDRKSTRLNSSHTVISYAVFCLKKKKKEKPKHINTPN